MGHRYPPPIMIATASRSARLAINGQEHQRCFQKEKCLIKNIPRIVKAAPLQTTTRDFEPAKTQNSNPLPSPINYLLSEQIFLPSYSSKCKIKSTNQTQRNSRTRKTKQTRSTCRPQLIPPHRHDTAVSSSRSNTSQPRRFSPCPHAARKSWK